MLETSLFKESERGERGINAFQATFCALFLGIPIKKFLWLKEQKVSKLPHSPRHDCPGIVSCFVLSPSYWIGYFRYSIHTNHHNTHNNPLPIRFIDFLFAVNKIKYKKINKNNMQSSNVSIKRGR
jgi:hypothetical protein